MVEKETREKHPQQKWQGKERTEGPREIRHCGKRESIEWGGLIERDITRNANTTSNGVIATITLMIKTLTQKNTRNGLSGELCSLPRGEQNKAATTKNTNMIIAKRSAMETLTRATITKTRGRLQVNEVNNSADSVNPEMRWNGGP